MAARLTGEYKRIEDAARGVEDRSAAAARNESMALAELRGQLQQTETGIKQSTEEASAFKIELEQLREVAARLTGEYQPDRRRNTDNRGPQRGSGQE